MPSRTWLGLLPVVLILVMGMIILQGCSDDPTDPEPSPEAVDLPPSTSVHILMGNFMTVNEDMYIEGYEHILHDGFRIIILPQTRDAWEGSDYPLEQLYFDRAASISISENMFSGEQGVNEAGIAIPPIASINFDVMDIDGPWELVDDTVNYFGDFENVYKASYDFLMYFNNPTNHRYEISQRMNFYAVDLSGGELNDWQLLGIDAIYGKTRSGTEEMTYDSLLSIYR